MRPAIDFILEDYLYEHVEPEPTTVRDPILTAMFADASVDDPPPTARRPDLSEGIASAMNRYPVVISNNGRKSEDFKVAQYQERGPKPEANKADPPRRYISEVRQTRTATPQGYVVGRCGRFDKQGARKVGGR